MLSLVPGKTFEQNNHAEAYIRTVRASLGPLSLDSLRIAVDCGHGAACELVPSLLRDRFSAFRLIGVAPDGFNINQGYGSEAPERLQEEVKKIGADVGIAFDGDADRAILLMSREMSLMVMPFWPLLPSI